MLLKSYWNCDSRMVILFPIFFYEWKKKPNNSNESLEKLKFKIGNSSKNTKLFDTFKTFETKEKFV